MVEKVRPIRQLKKEAITLDEDRWHVFVGHMWQLNGSGGCDMAWLKAIWPNFHHVCVTILSQLEGIAHVLLLSFK